MRDAVEAELELPARIGPYLVQGELGRGGMGVVFRAEHETTRERVALKTVTGADGTRLAFFRREIEALRRVQHPGVVRIVDSGDSGGVPYYAMELLEGATLRSLTETLWTSVQRSTIRRSVPTSAAEETVVASEPPQGLAEGDAPAPGEKAPAAGGELPRVLRMLRLLCEPLAAMHARGLVHRDLKPENVFVRSDGTPVLVDLGVASRFGGARGREALEVGGLVIGSIAYMAPEQTRGELVDARADLYALGCILYECVTGRQPFGASTAGSLVYAHQFVVPPKPSDLVSGVPAALDDLVLALLAKRPGDRLGYASELASALERLGAPAPPPLSQAAPAVPAAYLYRARLAGRSDALRTLERAFVDGASAKGGLFFVGGESGVGKTRIVMEAATLAALRHRLRVLTGECLAVGVGDSGSESAVKAAPLHPFRHILDAVADRCRELGAAETDRLLGARGKVLAPYEPALAALPGQDTYPEPLPMPAQAARERVLQALHDTLLAFSRVAPLLIVLDDLQWADELTLSFLASLDADELAQEPLLIVGTHRTEEPSAALLALLATEAAGGARHLVLGPLEPRDVAAMAGDMLATHPMPEGFARFLAETSAGNPFFVSEYIRSIVEDGLLRRAADGRWELGADPMAGLPVVRSLAELVGRRLRTLRPETLEALRLASVLGRDLDLTTFASALGAGGMATEAGLVDIVEELLSRAIFELGEGGVVRFAHDKLREYAYSVTSAEERAQLHARAARAIEARWRGTPDLPLYYPVLAHHLTLSGAGREALDYLELSAEQALEAGSYREAIAFYQRALALAGGLGAPAPAPSRLARWDRRVGEATFALGDLSSSERHLSESLRRLGRPVPRSAPERARAFVGGLALQSARLLGLAPKVDVADDRHLELQELAQSAADLAFHYYFVNDIGGQLVMSLLSANEAERATREVPVPGPYIWLGYTAGLMRLHGLARRYFDKARENAGKARNRADHCFSLSLEAVYHFGYPNWAEARALTSQGSALLRDYDDPQRYELNRVVQAQLAFYTGDTPAADAGFAQLLRSAEKRQNAQHMGWAEYGGGRALALAGRPDDALALLDQALAHLSVTLDRATEMMALAWRAAALCWAGRLEEAWTQAQDTLRRLQAVAPAVVFTLDAYSLTADVLADLVERRFVPAQGTEAQVAKAFAQAVRELFKFALVFPFGASALARARGRQAALRGGRARSGKLFAASLAAAERAGMPGEAATTHLAMAQAQAGQPESRRLAKLALAAFERLGWKARAQQAAVLIA